MKDLPYSQAQAIETLGHFTEYHILSLQGRQLDSVLTQAVVGRETKDLDQGLMMFDPAKKDWVAVPKFHKWLDAAHVAEEYLLLDYSGEDYWDQVCNVVGTVGAGMTVNALRASAQDRCRACLLTVWRNHNAKA